jgi:hypothetical protein
VSQNSISEDFLTPFLLNQCSTGVVRKQLTNEQKRKQLTNEHKGEEDNDALSQAIGSHFGKARR